MPHQLRLIVLTALITAGLVYHVHQLRSGVEPYRSHVSTERQNAARGRLQAPGVAFPEGDFDSHSLEVHALRDLSGTQLIAHAFCRELISDISQCFLVDEADRESHIIGIEYIITESAYRKLPPEERGRLWHPHHYAVNSGLLVVLNAEPDLQRDFNRRRLRSYGKAFYFRPREAGAPRLAWSIEKPGEIHPEIVEKMAQLRSR